MHIVIIAKEYNDTSNSIVYDANSISDESMSVHMHLNSAAIKLQEILLSDSKCLSNINIPVLVVLDSNADLSSIVKKHIDTDTIFFNSLHNMIKPTAIYGSIVSITKVLQSANKIHHLFKNEKHTTFKPPFNGPCHELFQLVWYSQKIGLKVYASK
jgi:hypothetical protein